MLSDLFDLCSFIYIISLDCSILFTQKKNTKNNFLWKGQSKKDL